MTKTEYSWEKDTENSNNLLNEITNSRMTEGWKECIEETKIKHDIMEHTDTQKGKWSKPEKGKYWRKQE